MGPYPVVKVSYVDLNAGLPHSVWALARHVARLMAKTDRDA